jgi:hypothetical protein
MFPMSEASVIDNRACIVCGDDDEVLIECDDGKPRCPPCMADAGWCLSCGSKITGGARPELSLCGQCNLLEDV